MKLRKALVAVAVFAVGSFVLVPAASAADTTATFQITGALGITVPSSVALNTGTVMTGAASASGQLGSVNVTDERGVAAAWTTQVSGTPFTTGTGLTANEKIELAAITYGSGPATASPFGVGAFIALPTIIMSGAASTLTVNLTGGDGNVSRTWNPTLTFSLLPTQKAGPYTGTITHSVL
jgi:hypothetical protein